MTLVQEVEAVLFVADRPVTIPQLVETLEAPEGLIREAVTQLATRLQGSSALQIVHIAGGYQLSTKPLFAEVVSRFTKPQRQRLSRSIMEVLAIVAYQQPVTIAEVEAVRGVQSDYGIRQLLERRLIKEVGRKSTPGRPMLYGTTQQFLHQFNMNSIHDLPELQMALAARDVGELPAPPPEPRLPGL